MYKEIMVLDWTLKTTRVGEDCCTGILMDCDGREGRANTRWFEKIIWTEDGIVLQVEGRTKAHLICKWENMLLCRKEQTKEVLQKYDMDISVFENIEALIQNHIEKKMLEVKETLEEGDVYLEFCGELLRYCFLKKGGKMHWADTSYNVEDEWVVGKNIDFLPDAHFRTQNIVFDNAEEEKNILLLVYCADDQEWFDSMYRLDGFDGMNQVHIKQSSKIPFAVYGFEKTLVFRAEESVVKKVSIGESNHRGLIELYKKKIKALERED